VNIAGIEIGPHLPTRFTAEIGNAHGGDLPRALRLIDAAKEAGADFVKFQCFAPIELVALRGDGMAPDPWGDEGWTMLKLYEKAQTPFDWFGALVAHAKEVGIPWFSSVFGLESLALLNVLKCPAYKIAALDSQSAMMVDIKNAIRNIGKPIIESRRPYQPSLLPLADLTLYCPEGYPQTDFELFRLRGGLLGFSYHGTDMGVPFTAAVAGATMVEVHLQLADEPSELESNVSLTEFQLADLIEGVRAAEEWIL